MPTSTTVPAVKAYLLSAIQTQVGPDIQVSNYWPGPDTAGQGIYLGEVNGVSSLANLGPTRSHRDESYIVQVKINDWKTGERPGVQDGSDVTAAEAWCFDRYADIDEALSVDRKMGGLVISSNLASFGLDQPRPYQTGWAVTLTAGIACAARLT